jgi:hypothetical protein
LFSSTVPEKAASKNCSNCGSSFHYLTKCNAPRGPCEPLSQRCQGGKSDGAEQRSRANKYLRGPFCQICAEHGHRPTACPKKRGGETEPHYSVSSMDLRSQSPSRGSKLTAANFYCPKNDKRFKGAEVKRTASSKVHKVDSTHLFMIRATRRLTHA